MQYFTSVCCILRSLMRIAVVLASITDYVFERNRSFESIFFSISSKVQCTVNLFIFLKFPRCFYV